MLIPSERIVKNRRPRYLFIAFLYFPAYYKPHWSASEGTPREISRKAYRNAWNGKRIPFLPDSHCSLLADPWVSDSPYSVPRMFTMRFSLLRCFLLFAVVVPATESPLQGQTTNTPASSEEINQWIVQLQHDEDREPTSSPSAASLIEQGAASIPAIRTLLLNAKQVSRRSRSSGYTVRLPGTDKDSRFSDAGYSRACQWALYVLVEIGPETIPLLVEAVNQGTRNTEVSNPAGEALRRLTPKGVDALVKLLDSPQEYVRHIAIYELGDNYPYHPSRIPGNSRLTTLAQLGELEQMVNIWIAASKNRDYYVRYKAFVAMENAGEYEDRVIPLLVEALRDQNDTVRQGACDAFADMGTDNVTALNALLQTLHTYPDTSNLAYALAERKAAAIPGLLEALKSRNPKVRGVAADVLGRLGPSAAEYVPQLAEALKGVEFDYDLPEHLAKLGPQVVPILEYAYEHGSRKTRQAVVNDVEKLGGNVIPLLIRALKDGDPYVRRDAASTLGDIKGKVPTEAIPVLEAALKHTETRYAAASALCNAGPEAIPSLARGLQQGDARTRGSIVSCMRQQSRYDDKRAYVALIPDLVTILDTSGYEARERIIDMIEDMETDAVPPLIAIIENSKAEDRRRALTLLKQNLVKAKSSKPTNPYGRPVPTTPHRSSTLWDWLMGRPGSHPAVEEPPEPEPEPAPEIPGVDIPRVVELLRTQLPDDDVTIRLRAVDILAMFGADSASAVPQLVDRLRGDETSIRIAASQALGRIGASAVPALIGGLEDDLLRDYAADALSRVGSSAVPALLELQKSQDRRLRNLAGNIIVRHGSAAVRPLQQALKSEDPQVRRRVTFALGEIGAPAVSALTEALESEDAEVRMLAADGLGRIGEDAKRAVSQLVVAISDNDERVRLVAVDALGAIGSEAGSASDELAATLKERILRARAAEALGKIGNTAVPVLLQAINHEDSGVREAAIYAVGRAGKDNPDVVEPLVSVLMGKSETARLLAADSLGRVGDVAVPALVKALNDEELPERWLAALALGRMGEDGASAAADLAAALNDDDEQVRSAAAHALSELGPAAIEALPAMKECLTEITGEARLNLGWAFWTIAEDPWGPQVISHTLNDDELHVRVAAAVALGKIGTEAAWAVPKLTEALQDESPKVQAAAALALGQIGTDAKAAIPALEKSLETVTDETRLNVGWAMWEISKHRWAISAISHTLKSEDAAVRVAAANSLARIGKPAASVAPALTQALRDRHAQVRSAAAVALGEIANEAHDSSDVLTEVLNESVGESRLNTAWAIWQLKKDKAVIGDLIATLGDPSSRVRYGSAAALAKIGSDAKESVPALSAALRDNSPKVRAMAAAALGQMGTDAAPATPTLLEAVRDEDEMVQKYAASALLGSGAKFYEVMPTLVKALQGEDLETRKRVAVALVGKPDENAELTPIDRLVDVLKKGTVAQRCTAAMLLGTRKEAKNRAISDLAAALHEDESSYVQWCAKWSLSILRPEEY